MCCRQQALLLATIALPGSSASRTPPRSLTGQTVAVVGGGVGGLVSAGLLAAHGAHVTVFEQRSKSGGRLGERRLGPGGEWRFDVGPSLLLMPEVYAQTFELLGDPLPLEMTDVTAPFYHAYFDGDARGTAPIQLDPARRRAALERALEQLEGHPGDSMERFDRYMSASRASLDGGWPLAIEERWDWATVSQVLPRFARAALADFPANLPVGQSHMAQLERYFPRSERVRALLSFQDLYVGLSPFEAPAVFSLLQAMELDADCPQYGVRYPLGGFGQVARKLEARCDALGVTRLHGSRVVRVEVSESDGDAGREARATGVRVQSADGTMSTVDADIVLCNADLPAAEASLLELPWSRAAELRGAASSSSVVSFSFALDAQFDEALAHHSILFAHDLGRGPWEALFGASRPSSFLPVRDPPAAWEPGHFYVHCPTRTDASAAPPGCDAITVLLPTPPLPPDLDDTEAEALSLRWTELGRAAVVERLSNLPGMSEWTSHICDELVITPAQWRREYGLSRGAVFGLASGLNQLSFLRPGPKHPRVRNLYYTGASARPGNGVPLVMTGARLTSELIARECGAQEVSD